MTRSLALVLGLVLFFIAFTAAEGSQKSELDFSWREFEDELHSYAVGKRLPFHIHNLDKK